MRPTWPSGVSTPSYSRWAIDIVRLGLKPSLRLASCWSVLVVNGGAGLRFDWRLRDRLDDRSQARGSPRRGARRSRRRRCRRVLPSIRTRSAVNVVAGGRLEQRLERPVLAGGERADLALALDDHAHRDRLDAARRQAAADLARQERAQRVADQPVDDAPRLLGVDEVLVDLARVGERVADRALGDLARTSPGGACPGGRWRPRPRATRSPRPRGRGRWRARRRPRRGPPSRSPRPACGGPRG